MADSGLKVAGDVEKLAGVNVGGVAEAKEIVGAGKDVVGLGKGAMGFGKAMGLGKSADKEEKEKSKDKTTKERDIAEKGNNNNIISQFFD